MDNPMDDLPVLDDIPARASVAANVRRLRTEAKLTLDALAQRLTREGFPMSVNTLSKIERNVRAVDVDELEALSVALGVPYEDLMTHPRFSHAGDRIKRGREIQAEIDWWRKHYRAVDAAESDALDRLGALISTERFAVTLARSRFDKAFPDRDHQRIIDAALERKAPKTRRTP